MQRKSSNPFGAVSPAREAAFEILLRVDREGSYGSELLHSSNYEGLSTRDHSLATELVMGVLRWRSLLDLEIEAKSSQLLRKLDLEVLTALRLALYQLRYLDRVPAWAAINGSVELVKRARKLSAAPFVNAILRKLASENLANGTKTETASDSSSPESIAARLAHPSWLVERWIKAYGPEATLEICRHDQSIPRTAIRLRRPDAEGQLGAEGIELTSGAILASARIVQHGEITKAAAFRQGQCVIQDEGSLLVAALLGFGETILDCCAAPGGKTLAIADRNPHAAVAAVELHPHRARLLKKLLSAQTPTPTRGSQAIQVIVGDARNLPLAAKFDRVLADVPCSGTGTLARNPEIKWRLDAGDLSNLQARQLAILRSTMANVAAGGRLVYSTCSLEREENEDVIERALADYPSFRVLDCASELRRFVQNGELAWADVASLTRGPFLRTIPGIHPCDGFFAALLEKT